MQNSLVCGSLVRLGQWAKLSTQLKSCAHAVLSAAHSLHLEAPGNKKDIIAVLQCFVRFVRHAHQRDFKTRTPICDKVEHEKKFRKNLGEIQRKFR